MALDRLVRLLAAAAADLAAHPRPRQVRGPRAGADVGGGARGEPRVAVLWRSRRRPLDGLEDAARVPTVVHPPQRQRLARRREHEGEPGDRRGHDREHHQRLAVRCGWARRASDSSDALPAQTPTTAAVGTRTTLRGPAAWGSPPSASPGQRSFGRPAPLATSASGRRCEVVDVVGEQHADPVRGQRPEHRHGEDGDRPPAEARGGSADGHARLRHAATADVSGPGRPPGCRPGR